LRLLVAFGGRFTDYAADHRYENLSQAAWRDIPKTLPMAFQLIPRFRNISIWVCSTVRVAFTVATAGPRERSN